MDSKGKVEIVFLVFSLGEVTLHIQFTSSFQ